MQSKEQHGGSRFEIRLEHLNKPWLDVLHMGTRTHFRKGYVVRSMGESGFFLLTRGQVRLTYVGNEGQERGTLFLGNNCIFNEIPAMGQAYCSTSFCCMDAVEAWRFEAELLLNVDFISQYPHLIVNLLQSLARKSGLFFQQLSARCCSTSMSQVCAMLLELSEAPMPRMSQSEVAAVLGLHITTVARLIRALRDEGILGKFTKSSLEILDMERLREKASGHRRDMRHGR